jgi:hypothetical protein
MSHQFREFVESMKIKLLNCSPYYVQANGQAEASNKVLIKIIKKRIKDNPRRWHENCRRHYGHIEHQDTELQR